MEKNLSVLLKGHQAYDPEDYRINLTESMQFNKYRFKIMNQIIRGRCNVQLMYLGGKLSTSTIVFRTDG